EGLADAQTRLILAGRSLERTQPVLDAVRARGATAEFVELDLASLSRARSAARTVLSMTDGIDVLINNAGVAGARGQTADGFEMPIGVNHLGHFAWTKTLLPRLLESGTRVVVVASEAHRRSQGLDFAAFEKPTQSMLGWTEYCNSKLCNVLFARELAKRYDGQ